MSQVGSDSQKLKTTPDSSTALTALPTALLLVLLIVGLHACAREMSRFRPQLVISCDCCASQFCQAHLCFVLTLIHRVQTKFHRINHHSTRQTIRVTTDVQYDLLYPSKHKVVSYDNIFLLFNVFCETKCQVLLHLGSDSQIRANGLTIPYETEQ